jgi:hypothetical protein
MKREMDVKVKMMAAAAAAVGVLLSTAGVAVADPGPGGTNPAKVCAPGQQGNPEPGFRPPACEPGTGSK